MAGGLSWSMIVLIVYAATYLVIVVAIGIFTFKHRKDHTITYCEELVFQREIYGAVIVHIYDQSTDVAVMVNWGRLTVQELNGQNVEGVNMLSFLLPGIFVMFLYRFITLYFVWRGGGQNSKKDSKIWDHLPDDQTKATNEDQRGCKSFLFDIFLAIFDLYFIKIIYHEFVKREAKPSSAHRSLQLCESVCESMPQVVLQSVFLLRYSISGETDFFSSVITIFSIIASLLSIANKFFWFDQQACVDASREMFCCKMKRYPKENQKIPFSWKFIVRSVWRWSDLCVRFVIFSLLWVCIGGFWIMVYIVFSCLYYFAVVTNRITETFWRRMLITVMCEIGMILDYEPHFSIFRCIDNGVMMCIVSAFLFSHYPCQLGMTFLCSDNSNRNISETPMLGIFCVMGWIGYGLELVTYPILQYHKLEIIKQSLQGREFFNIVLHGADGVPVYFLTFYIEENGGCNLKESDKFTTTKSMEACNRLGEKLELLFSNDDSNIAGDIAVNYKMCKQFKYGISMEVKHQIYDENHTLLLGDNAMTHIKELYASDGEYIDRIIEKFKEHFEIEESRDFKVKCTKKIFGFLVLESGDIVAKYRLGKVVKTYSKSSKVVRGHDLDDLHNEDKQVLITVIEDREKGSFNNDLFQREKHNLAKLNASKGETTKGIVPYKGSDKGSDAFFVVTKSLNGDKLMDYITQTELTMKKVMTNILEMFEIIAYLHSKNIVHRNINVESFQFMDKEMKDLALTDYEYSKEISDSNELKYGNICGKLLYLSPEMCKEVKERVMVVKQWRGDVISGEMYKKSDVWALGVLTYFLLTGQRLFVKSHHKLKTVYKITTFDGIRDDLEPFPIQKSNELFIDFMDNVLQSDYTQRMSISECLKHEFLSKAHLNEIDEDLMIENDINLNQMSYQNKSKLHAAILKVHVNEMIEREETAAEMLQKTESEFEEFADHKHYKSMREQFNRMDLDNDGYTTLEELTTLLASLGYSTHYAKKQSQIIMEQLDENGDGKIEFKEFATSWLEHKLDTNEKYIHAIFEVFDANGDGNISIDELRSVLLKNRTESYDIVFNEEIDNEQGTEIVRSERLATFDMEEKEMDTHETYDSLEQMLNEIDEDGNGLISFDEFYKAMSTDLSQKNESSLFNTIIKDINFMFVNEFGKDELFENEKDYEVYDESDVDVERELHAHLKTNQ